MPRFNNNGAVNVQTGGTGLNSLAAGSLLYGPSSSYGTLASLAIGAANRVLLSDGSAPTWSANVPLLNAVNSFTGFGIHTWSAGGTGHNALRVRNTTAGTGNTAYISLGNDAAVDRAYAQLYSSTYSTTGRTVADGLLIENLGAGGMSYGATNATGMHRWYTGGGPTEQMRLHTSGGLSLGNTTDPGATNLSVTGTVTAGAFAQAGAGGSAPTSVAAVPSPTAYYGSSSVMLGDPTAWLYITISGATRKIPCYA